MNQTPQELLRKMFNAAVNAAQPAHCIPPHLPPRLVVGSWSSALARRRQWPGRVEEHWVGELSGLAVTRYGYAVPCQRIEIVEAAHPVPDAAGLAAARRILDLVERLSTEDVVLCLISGGGSSLLVLPAEGLTLEDKQSVNTALLKSGASISEMNCVRRHGKEEIAGATLSPDSLARAWAKGIRPKDSLANNDGHGFFGALGDSLVTGPTLTNVNDFRAVLVTAEACR